MSRESRSTAGVITTSPAARRPISFELRALGVRAGDLLAEYLLTPGHLELAHLSGFILGGGGDAGIAVNHARIVHPASASQKVNRISGVRKATSALTIT